MKGGLFVSLAVSVVVAGCGNPSGLFDTYTAPDAGYGSVITGDGVTAPIRQIYTQHFEFPAFDILWVIDNSGSMADEIAGVRSNVATFAQKMQTRRNIQYQFAVINTDWQDTGSASNHGGASGTGKGHGQFRGATPIIKYSDSDPIAEFQDAMSNSNLNYCASGGSSGTACYTAGAEMGLAAARQALSNNGYVSAGTWGNFIRDQSNLVVIAVSDEEDVSCKPNAGGTACASGITTANVSAANRVLTSDFINYFKNVKATGTGEMLYYPVVGIENPKPASCDWASLGTRYLDVLAGLDVGAEGSICTTDTMLNGLNRVANDIADFGVCFNLAYSPKVVTIAVYIDGVEKYQGYSLDTTKNAICFDLDHIPHNGEQITLEYYKK